MAQREDRPLLPPADRSRVGIRLPRRHDDTPIRSATMRRKLGEYAWFSDNSDGKYQKVGKKKPNPWGLHDMHGNVMEWTLDQYDPKGYAGSGQRQSAGTSLRSRIRTRCAAARGWMRRRSCAAAARVALGPVVEAAGSRNCRRASGITPTRKGSGSASFGR